MFENIKEENVVEQTPDNDNTNISEVSAEDAPTASIDNLEEPNDYLNPSLFKDVKVIDIDKIDKDEISEQENQKVESIYANTFGDISENTLVEGRVVGMNDRDVLIDIGFKSEGIIDRSEFDKNDLPKIGDHVEVYLEYIEDAGGNTILSKEKADFMRRWKELNDAFDKEKNNKRKKSLEE